MALRPGHGKEKGRPVSRTAFPVLRQLHIKRAISNLETGGLSPGRVLLGGRCKSGQSRLDPEPTRWFPISARWLIEPRACDPRNDAAGDIPAVNSTTTADHS